MYLKKNKYDFIGLTKDNLLSELIQFMFLQVMEYTDINNIFYSFQI